MFLVWRPNLSDLPPEFTKKWIAKFEKLLIISWRWILLAWAIGIPPLTNIENGKAKRWIFKNYSEGVIFRVISLLKIGTSEGVLSHISARSYAIAYSFLYVPTRHLMSLWKEYETWKSICRLVGDLWVALQKSCRATQIHGQSAYDFPT